MTGIIAPAEARHDIVVLRVVVDDAALTLIAPLNSKDDVEFVRLVLHEGYSPQQQAAITDQSMGSLGNVYDTLRGRAGNRLAQTRNSAGYGETLDEMARQEGRDKSGLAQQNQTGFANEEQQRRLEGLQGIASLYGVDTNLLGHGLGIPADLLRSRVAASQGNSGIFNSLLGAIGQIGSSAIGTVGG